MDWNFRNDQPIYSQLTQRLTEAIVSGIYAPGGLLIHLRIDQTLRCKHRHKAGADDRKRQTKRKNALHQPIFFSVMIFPHSGAVPAS